jgi:hypothetical protein
MLNALAPNLPGLIGGSADLAPSNMTLMKMFGDFQKNSPAERNLRFGVREHAMGAISNGIALHSPGFVPYCATFFIFTDYMRNPMRMSALSEAGVLYVMTHDSIGLGEDGPTHQPVEHLASFRIMPNMLTMRPGDGNETAGCYYAAVLNAQAQVRAASWRWVWLGTSAAVWLRAWRGHAPFCSNPTTSTSTVDLLLTCLTPLCTHFTCAECQEDPPPLDHGVLPPGHAQHGHHLH